MRVLHIMASGARGGGLEHLRLLLPALRRQGWQVEAALGDQGPGRALLAAEGIPAHAVRMMGSRINPVHMLRLRSLLQQRPADLIHLHGTRAAFYFALARFTKAPAVYTAHGLAFTRYPPGTGRRLALAQVERIAVQGVQRVISVSAGDLEALRREAGLRGPAHVVPNAVDLARFTGGDRLAARARLGLPAEAQVVGTVARLVRQKGIEDLLQAAQVTGGVDRWLIVGDGPLRERLQRQAAHLPVTWLGERHDIPQILAALDLFVLPSRWEGHPIALLEALAMGLPAVATATDGAREILSDPGVGVVVPRGSPALLAQAITTLLADTERRAALSSRGPEVARRWGPEAMAARVEEIYRDMIGRGGVEGP